MTSLVLTNKLPLLYHGDWDRLIQCLDSLEYLSCTSSDYAVDLELQVDPDTNAFGYTVWAELQQTDHGYWTVAKVVVRFPESLRVTKDVLAQASHYKVKAD